MICPKCGKKYNEGQTICESCNISLVNNTYEIENFNKTVSRYMVISILATIFCCIPFGIVAIVYSSKASKLLSLGDISNAMVASKKAKTWIIVAVVVGIVVGLVYSFLAFMGAFAFYGLYY